MTGPQHPAGFDFTDPDLYAARVPSEELAELRRAAPVWLNTQSARRSGLTTRATGSSPGTRMCVEVSRDSDRIGQLGDRDHPARAAGHRGGD